MRREIVSKGFVRQFSIGLIAATLLAGSAAVPAYAQTPSTATPQAAANSAAVALPDFTGIVEKADPAVVNIRTSAMIPTRTGRPAPRGPGGGADPYELFRWFFGPDFEGPGGVPSESPQGRGSPAPGPSEGRVVPRGLGSGFFISDDGYILTNNHVVAEATEILVTLTDGREFKAKVIGTDERTDVALIKIEAKGMTALPIGDPGKLKKGNWVLAIGSPFGLDSTVTAGIVSAIGRDTGEYLPFIQTDVAVNPGNSGGPLLNLQGQVVGINSQIVSRSGGFMGISLAIPIDEVMRVVDQLRATGKVTRGLIGVQIGEVGKDVAEAIGLSKAEGALVSSVQADGPAAAAGVEAGDVILKFGTHQIARWSDLPRVVGETKPGNQEAMEVWRRGKSLTLKVKVGELPAAKLAEGGAAKKAEAKANALGLSVADVPAEMSTQMHTQGGVLVLQAEGAAARAGLAAGDIILVVNRTEISGASQFEKIVSSLDKGKTAGVLVRRGDLVQWVAIKPNK